MQKYFNPLISEKTEGQKSRDTVPEKMLKGIFSRKCLLDYHFEI
jgi:hypothetical protein